MQKRFIIIYPNFAIKKMFISIFFSNICAEIFLFFCLLSFCFLYKSWMYLYGNRTRTSVNYTLFFVKYVLKKIHQFCTYVHQNWVDKENNLLIILFKAFWKVVPIYQLSYSRLHLSVCLLNSVFYFIENIIVVWNE